jgi:hypothetical protein
MTLKGLIHIDIAKIPGQTDYIEKATSCATVAVSVLHQKSRNTIYLIIFLLFLAKSSFLSKIYLAL